MTGQGNKLGAYYEDEDHDDNSGKFAVEIYTGHCLAPDVPPD